MSRSRLALVLGLLFGTAFLGGQFGLTAATGATATKRLTVYAVPARAQFMNHADDRIRGMSANPFTPDQQALVIVANGTEKKNGPFPGDDVLYTFNLYPTAKLTGSLGSALFTCYYTFLKRATCDAYFELGKDVLVASGQIKFASERFVLSITGGTNSYLGTHGQVTAEPAANEAKKAQRLSFELLPS